MGSVCGEQDGVSSDEVLFLNDMVDKFSYFHRLTANSDKVWPLTDPIVEHGA